MCGVVPLSRAVTARSSGNQAMARGTSVSITRSFAARVATMATLALTVCLVAGGCGAGSAEPRAVASDSLLSSPTASDGPRVVVYDGPAACSDCAAAAATWLAGELPNATIEFAGPDGIRDMDAATLAGAALYVQPGGGDDVAQAYDDLGPEARAAITDYVRGGGRYLGICMGAFLAGSDPGLDLLGSSDTGGYIDLPNAEVRDDQDTLVTLNWDGRNVQAYFQDGSYVAGNLAGFGVVATYPGGPAVAVVGPSGDGVVGVIGTHPEAPASWYTEAGLPTDGRTGNQDVGDDLLHRLMTWPTSS